MGTFAKQVARREAQRCKLAKHIDEHFDDDDRVAFERLASRKRWTLMTELLDGVANYDLVKDHALGLCVCGKVDGRRG